MWAAVCCCGMVYRMKSVEMVASIRPDLAPFQVRFLADLIDAVVARDPEDQIYDGAKRVRGGDEAEAVYAFSRIRDITEDQRLADAIAQLDDESRLLLVDLMRQMRVIVGFA